MIIIKINKLAIPSDDNIIRNEAEEQLKYENVQLETQRMWNTSMNQ